jgi:hypothetical protein
MIRTKDLIALKELVEAGKVTNPLPHERRNTQPGLASTQAVTSSRSIFAARPGSGNGSGSAVTQGAESAGAGAAGQGPARGSRPLSRM